MNIETTILSHAGESLLLKYYEGLDPAEDLDGKELHGVHAYCFYDGKLLLVYSKKKDLWSPPGGGIEPGETYEDAVVREVCEETNMKVLYQRLIGYQDIYKPHRTTRQTRSFCIVEPLGDFECDPDGDIDEIKLVEPLAYKDYFDWKIVGDRVMEQAMALYKLHT